MPVQTASLGCSVRSKRLRAWSAMASRSRTRAAQSGLLSRNFCRRGSVLTWPSPLAKKLGQIVFKVGRSHGVEVGKVGVASYCYLVDAGWLGGLFRLTEQFAELESGLVELGFAVAGGAFEHGGDFVMLEAFDVVEDEDHAVAGR